MAFSQDELQRYARHIILSDFGGPAQQALKQSKVLMIGAGGLGSPVLQYLGAAGVGTLGIADDDVVSLSNLQRQTIHTTAQNGLPKVDSAARFIENLNPNVVLQRHNLRIDSDNGDELIAGYDVIVDGSDNFDTRYLVADLCEKHEKILVTAAVGQYDASLTTLKPHLRDENGNQYPRYRDIFPNKPEDGLLPTCEEAGIIGALTGIIGSMQAMEVIKEITGVGEGLAGRLLMFDSKSTRWQEIQYTRSS